jgi:hypothetical protein
MEAERGKLAAVISVPLIESPAHQYSVHEHCDLSIHTKFLNYSGRTIRMGTRNGVIYDLQPRSDRHRQDFIIRQELNLTDNLKASVRDRLLSHEGIESSDLRAFKKLFLETYRDQAHGVTLKFDYRISAGDINHQGGTIYLTELDIILSTKQDNIPLHPFSLEAMSHTPKSVRTVTEGGLGVFIVDNKETIGARYIRMMGKVVRIDPIKNGLKPDGVYTAYRGLMDNPRADLRDFIDFTPAEEIDKLGWLFTTFAEARNSPEREIEASLELKELDLETRKISAETTLTKSSQDLEKLELERQNGALQRELEEKERKHRLYEVEQQQRFAREEHEAKLEQMRIRDFYEGRSTVRKDTSEFVKFIPGLIIGAGAAFVALKGLFSK